MAEVGTVYVQVMPTTKGFAKALSTEGGKGGSLAGRAFNMSFGKLIGGSAIGNMIANVVGTVASTITSSMDTAISRVDTIANYPKVMKNLGYGTDQAEASIKALADGIDGLPTSLDGIVSMTQQLAPMCDGLDKATSLSLALNNMFLASGAPLADQERAMRQYSQILARGKVELQDWRTLQEVMPGQLNQVSQALLGAGKNSTDLYQAMKTGKVSIADFNDAILKLNEEGVDGFASFEQQARDATEGIGTAMDNLRNRTAKAMAKIIDHIGQSTISGVINNITSKFTYLADVVIAVMDSIVSKIDFAGFERAFGNVVACFEQVFSQGDSAVSFGEGIGNMINGLIPIIDALTPAIWAFANVLKLCIDNAGILIPIMIALGIAIGVVKFAMAIGPGVEKFVAGLTAVKPAVAANVKQMLALAVAAVGVGAGIALACVGVYALAQAAVSLAAAGPGAVVVLVLLAGVIVGLAVGAAALGPALTAGALGFVAFGAAVLMASVGMLALANAAVQLATAGPASVVVLVLLVGAIAGLAVGAAALGPALTAGALGFVAFGAAVLMASVGMAIVALSFSVLAMQLPLIATYGLQASVAIAAISGSLVLFAVSCAVAGVSTMVAAAGLVTLRAGAIVGSAGLTILAAAITVASAGMLVGSAAVTALAGAMGLLAAAVVVTASGIVAMGCAMPAIAGSAPGAAAGLSELALASAASALGVGACVPTIAALAASSMTAGAGVSALVIGLLAALAAALGLGAGIANVSSSMSGASSTFAAGCSSMAAGFDQVRARAESAMRQAVSAVQSAAATISGTRMEANVEFKLGKMPHFSMDGRFDAATGSVPRINVNWYGSGAIFRRPSIIGVAEAGTEVVENVDRLDGRIQRAVKAAMGKRGREVNQTFYVHANDPELVAATVAAKSRREG